MTYYVYSTATSSASYVVYVENSSKDLGVIKKDAQGKPLLVTINGGHGVANKHMFTPKGVVTIVNDEQMELLLANDSFQRHIKAGFITYDKKHVEPEKKAENMAQKDGSAPLTPDDFKESESSSSDTKIYKTKKG
jgi:hypothetical protein